MAGTIRNREIGAGRPTLSQSDITTEPSVGRRLVLGGGAGMAALAMVGCRSTTASLGVTSPTDADDGPRADLGNEGRGYCRAGVSAVTDEDAGVIADPANDGRGGVEMRRLGITDSDPPARGDPIGHGRGNSRSYSTATTDGDGNSYCTDPVNNGRNV